jgi:hypothetical protein
LAYLLEWGQLTVSDIWLFSRVVEDALDLILMSSRAEVRAWPKREKEGVRGLAGGVGAVLGSVRILIPQHFLVCPPAHLFPPDRVSHPLTYCRHAKRRRQPPLQTTPPCPPPPPQAELATIRGDVSRLLSLHAQLAQLEHAPQLHCTSDDAQHATRTAAPSGECAEDSAASHTPPRECAAPSSASAPGHLRLSLSFSRGAASASVPQLSLPSPGVFAVTGPNGCGKSSLFALLGACAAAKGRAGLPPGLTLHSLRELHLPRAGSVAHVAQRLYCPLHASPLDWLLSAGGDAFEGNETDAFATSGSDPAAVEDTADPAPRHDTEEDQPVASEAAEPAEATGPSPPTAARHALASRVSADATRLGLPAATVAPSELLRSHADFCGSLSGGQRVKLEVLRAVLLPPACPSLLLLDETFGALDPVSKRTLMGRIRSRCAPLSYV